MAAALGLCPLSVGATSAAAQMTYKVFPVTASAAPVTQPTDHSAPVTLEVRDSTIAYVVNALVHQSHLRVSYNDQNPAFAKRIRVSLVQANVMDALQTVLRGTGLEARLASDGETVVIRDRSGHASTESRLAAGIVAGRVTDSASGQGLGGAAVKVAGTKLSTVTSDSGNFTLRNVPAGEQVLSVRLFGYKPADRTMTVVDSQRTVVRIAMVAVPTVLSGVVTTATGLQRKLAVGNDITTINVDSVMQVAPVTSVTDLLETRVPGLTVLHASGTPGDPSRIRIRGVSSINGNNDPIVVVDGIRVYANQSDARNDNLAPYSSGGGGNTATQSGYAAPSPLDQIDPNSIETIEVFKGPSASALYGSDAANGVIVITTKHGRAGPTHWNVDLAAGLSYEPGDWPVNYYRFGYGTSSGTGSPFCAWYDLSCTQDSVVPFQALNEPQYSVFADHGSDQTIAATVSGGVPTLQYSLTGTAAGHLGILKLPGLEQQRYQEYYGAAAPRWMVRPDNYTTYGGSGQLTVQPTTKTKVTLTSSVYNSLQQRSSLEGAITQLEGEYINPALLGTSPLIVNEFERATDNELTSTNALTSSWQLTSWLPLTATAGLNTIQRTDNTLIPYGINSASVGNVVGDTTGSYGLGRGVSEEKTLNIGTTVPFRLVSVAVGGNYVGGSTNDFQAYTNQLSPGVTDPTTFPTSNGAGINSSFSQSTSAVSTYGWYVEPTFNFLSRFFVSPGFRLDGGSAVGSNAGLTGLPKIDLSYVAVDRPTQPLWGVLSLLRPRAAIGVAGTQPGPTDKLRLFDQPGTSTLISLNGALVPATFLTSLGNTQLEPETSRELEGGFDAALWNNRVQLTYTQYNKTRYNAIVSIPVAASVYAPGAGEFNIQYNIGEVRNTGTELTLNAQLLQSRAVGWNVGLNLSNDNNLLVRLNRGVSGTVSGVVGGDAGTSTRDVPGYPLNGAWAYPIVSYVDANHDGVIEANEIRYGDSLVYLGQEDPKYQMNITTDLSFLNGRLSVHADFAYQNGMTQSNIGALSSGAFALLGNAPGTSLATQAAIVASGTDNGFVKGQDFIGLVQTVNTFRFNALSINYTMPRTVSNLFRVPRMTLALQGSNLGLHTNYRGLDPNVNAFSTGNQTEDTGQLPEPRTWWLRISLGN